MTTAVINPVVSFASIEVSRSKVEFRDTNGEVVYMLSTPVEVDVSRGDALLIRNLTGTLTISLDEVD